MRRLGLRAQHLQQHQSLLLVAGLTKERVLGESEADSLLHTRALGVQRNSAGNRHREFRSAMTDLVQPLFGWMARFRHSYPSLVMQVYE